LLRPKAHFYAEFVVKMMQPSFQEIYFIFTLLKELKVSGMKLNALFKEIMTILFKN
jgi:hypothetical protein